MLVSLPHMSDMTHPRILTVVGTRPNFVKISQLHKATAARGWEYGLCHTGQHFDAKMSDVFFEELEIPQPDFHLGAKGGGVIGQIAQIMSGLERVLADFKPDILLVPGDVNSTFAAAFTAHKLGITVGHIESGLRSADRSMPEENNRILTDAITNLYFVTEEAGLRNLLAEGASSAAIHFVGNTMIDTLLAFQHKIEAVPVRATLGLGEEPYALLTMHRPATVDRREGLEQLLGLLRHITSRLTVVFAMHPRTRKNLEAYGLLAAFESIPRLKLVDPVGYLAFQNLTKHAKVVITDSGGVQEETTFYRVPCITLRANTERPSTTLIGSNTLFDLNTKTLPEFIQLLDSVLEGRHRKGAVPPLWDGRATERILDVLAHLSGQSSAACAKS